MITARSTVTGHRIQLPGQPAPKQTREMPFWVWPFEWAARIRAKMEGRYGNVGEVRS